MMNTPKQLAHPYADHSPGASTRGDHTPEDARVSPRSTLRRLVLPLHSVLCVACGTGHAEGHHEEAHHPIVLTSPAVMNFPTSEEYVSQIHSRRHIEVRALEEGDRTSMELLREGITGDILKVCGLLYQDGAWTYKATSRTGSSFWLIFYFAYFVE